MNHEVNEFFKSLGLSMSHIQSLHNYRIALPAPGDVSTESLEACFGDFGKEIDTETSDQLLHVLRCDYGLSRLPLNNPITHMYETEIKGYQVKVYITRKCTIIHADYDRLSGFLGNIGLQVAEVEALKDRGVVVISPETIDDTSLEKCFGKPQIVNPNEVYEHLRAEYGIDLPCESGPFPLFTRRVNGFEVHALSQTGNNKRIIIYK